MTVKEASDLPSCRYENWLPSSDGRERCPLPGRRPAAGQKDSAEGSAMGTLRGFQLPTSTACVANPSSAEGDPAPRGYDSLKGTVTPPCSAGFVLDRTCGSV